MVVIVATLLTVMILPVKSAITTAASAPAFQSSAAAKLYVVAPTELVPFLLSKLINDARSVAPRLTVKLVASVISTLVVLFVKVNVAPPCPVIVNLVTSISLVAPDSFNKLAPVTTKDPVDILKVAEEMVGTATLLTVIGFPVKSAFPKEPAIQSAAAAKLNVVAPVEVVPFLLSI